MHAHYGVWAVPVILGYHRRGTTSALCVFDLEYVLCQSVQMKVLSDMMHTVSPVMGGGHEVIVWEKQVSAVLESLGSYGEPKTYATVIEIADRKKM